MAFYRTDLFPFSANSRQQLNHMPDHVVQKSISNNLKGEPVSFCVPGRGINFPHGASTRLMRSAKRPKVMDTNQAPRGFLDPRKAYWGPDLPGISIL